MTLERRNNGARRHGPSSGGRVLKHKGRLRQLWQITRDPACKAEVNWITKTNRRMTSRKALERCETKVVNLKLVKACGINGIPN